MNSNESRNTRYLLIGPMTSNKKNSIGGTAVSFQKLVDYFEHNKLNYKVINTNHYSGFAKDFLKFFYVITLSLFRIPVSDVVVLNVSPRVLIYLAPIIYIISRFWNRKIVIRIFGGSLIEFYKGLSPIGMAMLKTSVFKADLLLLQTKRLMNYFEPIIANLYWLPTSRKTEIKYTAPRSYNKRFVYIGQISRNKGIEELIQLKNQLPADYSLEIYGPILDQDFSFLASEHCYKGVLKPEEVSATMNSYDVLILPTYHQGEGYPGIIIEANQLAIPVIATDWLAISELVIHGKTGILVQPRSVEELAEAVFSLTNESYQRLSQNAYEWGLNFNSDRINNNLVIKLDQL